MTLRLRLLLVLVGIVAAGLIVSDVVTFTSLESFLGTRLNQQLRAAREPVAHALEVCYQSPENDPLVSPSLNTCRLNLTEAAQVPSGTYGELRNTRGTPLAWTCFSPGDHASSSPLLPSLPPTGVVGY